MSDMIYYIPIICCGEPMTEIYAGNKRIGAMCQKCKATWRPETADSRTWKIETVIVKKKAQP
jgi:hypothetical protein